MHHRLAISPRRGRLQSIAAIAFAVAALQLPMLTGTAVLAANPEQDTAFGHIDGTAIEANPMASPAIATPVASPVPTDPAVEAIESLLESEIGVYGVVLMRPDGSVIYSRNGDMPFVSASLYKLVLMADICAAVDAGALTYETPIYVAPEYFLEYNGMDSYYDISFAGMETTVGEALYAAGAYSSNVAAKALLSLTTAEALNQTAASLGLTGTFLFKDPTTTPDWPPVAGEDAQPGDASAAHDLVLSYATDGQVNLTTPNDMATFFVKLVNGQVINERVSATIFDILHQQMVNDRIPALLPPGTQFVHKTGNLERVVHDVGVIYAPAGPVVLAAMVEAPSNDDRATEVIQRLALIAYGIYDVPAVTAPVYPTVATPVALDGTAVMAAHHVPVADVSNVDA